MSWVPQAGPPMWVHLAMVGIGTGTPIVGANRSAIRRRLRDGGTNTLDVTRQSHCQGQRRRSFVIDPSREAANGR